MDGTGREGQAERERGEERKTGGREEGREGEVAEGRHCKQGTLPFLIPIFLLIG